MAVAFPDKFNYFMNIATNWTPTLTQAGGTWKWDWWPLYEGYGQAQLNIACSALTGRVPQTNWNAYASYFAAVTNDINTACNTVIAWSTNSSYRTPFAGNMKNYNFSYYFGPESVLPVPINYELRKFYGQTPSPLSLDCVARCFDFECGQNPANITRSSGLGHYSPLVNPSQWARNAVGYGSTPGFIQGTLSPGYGSAGDSGNAVNWPPTGTTLSPAGSKNADNNQAIPCYQRIEQDRYSLSVEPTFPQWCYNQAVAVWNYGMASYPAPTVQITFTGTPTKNAATTYGMTVGGVDLTQAAYSWQFGTNFVSSVAAPVWTPAASGAQTVIGQATVGGKVYSTSTNLTVAP